MMLHNINYNETSMVLWECMIAESVRCLAVSHFLIMLIPHGSHLRSIAHEDKEYSGWNFIEAIGLKTS